MTAPAPEYVLARRALLDALDVLGPHQGSLVLIGAQAVYLHAPTGFGTAAYTTDADLAIDPDLLAATPEIAATLESAGYTRTKDPGTWDSPLGVHIDLMVPHALVQGRTRRSAPLRGHHQKTARRTLGLELALIDNEPRAIGALDPGDRRSHVLKVAGPTALVLAKLVKIRERLEAGGTSRVLPKDAGDLLRLLRTRDALGMGQHLQSLAETTTHGDLIASTAAWAADDVSRRDSRLIALTMNAAEGSEPERQLSAAVRTLIRQVTSPAVDAR